MKTPFKLNFAKLFGVIGLLMIFYIDLFVPLGFAVGILYVPCLFIISGESVTTILTFTLTAVVFIILKVVARTYYPIDTDWMITEWLVLFNRSASVVAVIVIGLMAVRFRMLREKTDSDKKS